MIAGRREDDYLRAKGLLASAAPAERADGIALLRELAEDGHARAQFRLGLLLAQGADGLAADPAAAARWCSAAARQGLGKAQFNLALLHAGGHGLAADPVAAGRWLRLASANGVEEAERCLDLVHADPGPRPVSWDEAETRASVALARSDGEGGKAVRFAEYYVDPCITILIQHLQLSREQGEDIVQQFMLELEQPLAKGEHQGWTWKESLRERFARGQARGQQRFRPYLYRVLVNFARDCLRDQRREGDRRQRPDIAIDPAQVVEHHAEEWRSLLARFAAAAGAQPGAARAVQAIAMLLGEGVDQKSAAERLAVSDRTVRHDLRLGSELLLVWLRTSLASLALDQDRDLRAGLQQLPDWLHHPIGIKRLRILLFLALAERRMRPQGR